MTPYDIAKFYGYNSVEEYYEAQKHDSEIFLKGLEKKKTYVEKEPVKHGRWIWDPNAPYREYGAYKCSICGCHSDFEENYCYNCGARMIKEEEEKND